MVEILGRQPTPTELGIFSVMWSEHCSYKSSRVWLKTLPTDGPQVIQGPGENAGVVDIGDGDAVVFKMESHNHPSYIEPYQGAATALAGSCATCSPWARAPWRTSMPCASARRSTPKPGISFPAWLRGSVAMATARAFRRWAVKSISTRATTATSSSTRCASGSPSRTGSSTPRRTAPGNSGGLRRLQDRARRHPRRDHGVAVVRPGQRGESARPCRSATRSPKSC